MYIDCCMSSGQTLMILIGYCVKVGISWNNRSNLLTKSKWNNCGKRLRCLYGVYQCLQNIGSLCSTNSRYILWDDNVLTFMCLPARYTKWLLMRVVKQLHMLDNLLILWVNKYSFFWRRSVCKSASVFIIVGQLYWMKHVLLRWC